MQDAGELFTLQRAAYVTEAQAHKDLSLPPLTQSLDELARGLVDPEVTAFGLRVGGARLLAAVRVRFSPTESHTAEVGRLVVAPDMQGEGRGSRLLEFVEKNLPDQVQELHLFTGEHSRGNLRLYARFGYEETHRTPTPGGYALVNMIKRRVASGPALSPSLLRLLDNP